MDLRPLFPPSVISNNDGDSYFIMTNSFHNKSLIF